MDVISAVRQLGAAIQEDEIYIKYNLAKEKNNEDKELQDLIGQFNLIRLNLNEQFGDGDEAADKEKVTKLNEELRECYAKIMQNESRAAFSTAKEEFDALMNKVNGIIGLCVEGHDPMTCEPPSGCSGSCSSCSGCH